MNAAMVRVYFPDDRQASAWINEFEANGWVLQLDVVQWTNPKFPGVTIDISPALPKEKA